MQQNYDLKILVQALEDEIIYQRQREKKIQYLVYLLQGKGYPVTKVFEKQVKPIQTLRFDEYLFELEQKAAEEAELDRQVANEFSWRSDASYELLVNGPPLQPKKPDLIPELAFKGLPEYETTSEEEDDEKKFHEIISKAQFSY